MTVSNEIRVIQLIDSLEPGGAERMAVTIANSLSNTVSFSGLVVTRKEGSLLKTIHSKVSFFNIDKKSTFDVNALFRLRYFVKKNKVQIIHAHSSSYFFAILLKLTLPSLKIFWHDHLGNRPNLKYSNRVLKLVSILFNGVFVVNKELEQWALGNLKTANVCFLPNFIEDSPKEELSTFLNGEKGKRIVMLANLHSPKNHILALNSFIKSKIAEKGWTLHFVGKDFLDNYSDELKKTIVNNNLENSIFILGSCSDVSHVLSQSTVGILTSTYEGFPVTLLEYGRARLLTITSDVGYCSQVIRNGETGICFENSNEGALVKIFEEIENNKIEISRLADNLNIFVSENYTAKVVVNQILSKYTSIT